MNKNALANVKKISDYRFSNYTTYGCGGAASVAYFPESFSQTAAVYDYLIDSGIRFVVLGNGSNVLASDNPYRGAVICTKRLRGIRRTGENALFCRAGTSVNLLLKYCTENGFGGLEFLAGIPATVGGIVCMNGGAANNYIGERVTKVKFYDGKFRTFSNNYCNFANKYSTMRDINGVVLGAEIRFDLSESSDVAHKIEYFLRARANQPKGKSCGCVFKNPKGLSAGKIIDEAGLKGLKSGCAEVSSEHANFILNRGDSSADVYRLIREVKRRVFEKTGIVLEEEVVYIGEFNDTDS